MIQNLNLELSSKARFNSIDGASLMEKDLPRKKFIINSLLTSGLSIIAGSPKVGKSWLVLDWCIRIAKGEDVWNLHTDSGTTLYLSLEDDESRLQDRLTAITDEVPCNVHFVTDCSKLNEKLEEQIRTFVDEHMDTVLIIIDTFQLIRSANKDLSYSNDYLEVQKLKKLADELKIAILLVHHLRKQGDSDPINEISGTNGIAGCADALFVLKKSNRTQGNATLFCTGRDIEDREIELEFSKEDCTWKMTADSAENPNMLLPDEMNLLIEMMKAEKYFNGSNAEFLERYNAFSGKNLSARILKRMMNKWKYDLNDNHIYFKSYKENNIRKVEIKYDFEIDNSDSEYVRYDKYDENIAV
ncbi:MAG: helicase RepA family protein [Ruminococcus sp.]|jgi:RecA-family ATPase|nr:helicase RepA family protein [Ruminococcus sp.]